MDAIKVTLLGQTDDDWYKLEVLALNETGQSASSGYFLKMDRLAKNVCDVKFSRDGRTVAAVECDGTVVVWKRGSTGTFDDIGQMLYVGWPIFGLEVEETGARISVHCHQGRVRTWVRDQDTEEFAPAD
jgi:hypothetical protein